MAKKFLSNIELDAGLIDASNSSGSSGQILSSTGSTVSWIDNVADSAASADKALSLTITVKNTESVALTKGQVVCAAPTATPPSGNVIEVKLADNNGTDSMPAIGVLNEGLDAAGGANDEGEAIMFGRISGIDTSAFSVGDEVFVSDTPGGLTTTKPTGVKYIQKVGVVIRDDATNGTIEVFGAGRVNDVPTPLYIDHANQRLGIGAESPATKLDVYGTSDTYLTIRNNGGGYKAGIRLYGGSAGISHIWHDDTETNPPGIHLGTSANTATAPTTQLYIKGSNGNVGIGTTSPSQKLDVSGNIKMTETAATSDTDKFVVLDSGVLKYRTGSQIVSDLPTDGRYVAVAGDTMTGSLDVNADIQGNTFTQAASGIPRSNLGTPTVTEMALFEQQFKPQTTLANNYNDLSDLTFWVQTTSSSSWTEITTYSDDQKRKFLRTFNSSVIIPNDSYKFRVEFRAKDYTFANALSGYWSSNSHQTQVHIYKYNVLNSTWTQHTSSSTNIGAWPGHMYLPFSTIRWHETNTTSSGHHRDIRIEFTPTWIPYSGSGTDYSDRDINIYGLQIWGGYPSGRRTPHYYDQNGKLSTWGDFDVNGDAIVDGNVGIGTTSPQVLLDVGGSNTNGKSLQLRSGDINTGTDSAQIIFSYNGGTWNSNGYAHSIRTRHEAAAAENNAIDFWLWSPTDTSATLGSTRVMTIEGTGRVGIGETNPDYKLHIDATSGGFLKVTESGADRLTLDSNGEMFLTPPSNWGGYFKVGKDVGPYEVAIELGEGRTANNLARIDLIGDTTYTDYGFRIIRNNGGANTTSQLVHRGTGNFELVSTDSGDIILNPNNGNVGIGTTSPSKKLHVVDSGNEVAYFEGTGNSSWIDIKGAASELWSVGATSIGYGIYNRTDSSYYFNIDNTGNVGIGITGPSERLDVVGNVIFGTAGYNGGIYARTAGNTADTNWGFEVQRTDGVDDYNTRLKYYPVTGDSRKAGIYNSRTSTFSLYSDTNNNPNIIIPDGNVGIGTTSPGTKLDVNGNNGTAIRISIPQSSPSLGDVLSSFETFSNDTSGGLSPSVRTSVRTITEDIYARNMGLSFGTSGADGENLERMRINSSGNVGIGTTSPAAKLTVVDDILLTGSSPSLTLTDATSSFVIKTNTAGEGIIQTSGTSKPIRFFRNNGSNESMRIDGAGNVGIGTTNPLQLLHLTKTGSNPYIRTSADAFTGLDIGQETSAGNAIINLRDNKDIRIFTNSAEVVRIKNNGNVGIGTTSPLSQLTVQSSNTTAYDAAIDDGQDSEGATIMAFNTDNTTTNSFAQILFRNRSSNVGVSRIVSLSTAAASTALAFVTENNNTKAEKMRIDSSGNVGIGTDSPSNGKLQIDSTGNQISIETGTSGDGRLHIGHFSNGTFIGTYGDDGGVADIIRFGTHSGDERMRIDSGGNIGIGTTSPNELLHISRGSSGSGLLLENTTGGSGSYITLDFNTYNVDQANFANAAASIRVIDDGAYSGDITFRTKGAAINAAQTEKMRIDGATGNVGIGTTSPSTKLQVNGGVLLGSTYTQPAGSSWTTSNSQLILGGAHNAEFNNDNPGVKLLITGYNNDGTTLYPIYVEDENGLVDFWLKNRPSGSGIPTAYFGGNVGIGTASPSYKLDVSGTGRFSSNGQVLTINGTDHVYHAWQVAGSRKAYAGFPFASSTNFTLMNEHTGAFVIGTNNSEKMRITSDGDVGINDTTPSYKLDVNGTIRATGDVIAYSDIRVKENIKTIDNAVDKVKALRGVEYNKIDSTEKSIGVIAQEIEEVIPQVVREDDQGMKSVAYGNITAVLIEAIKEQQKQIEELKSIINGSSN